MALTIALDTYSAKIGEAVTITSTGDIPLEFNTPHNKNVVTFNGVIADILSGDEFTLVVTVPHLATNGYVVVETFLDDVEPDEQRATSPEPFTVQYDDDKFPENAITPDPYHKGYINERVKTLSTDPSSPALYNRDMSYSRFVEVTDENSMVQNFLSLILTGKLERMWEPNFGSDIPKIPFRMMNTVEEAEAAILDEADRLIKQYELRIVLIRSQSFVVVDPDTNKISALFAIKVPTGNVREVGVTLGQVQNETM